MIVVAAQRYDASLFLDATANRPLSYILVPPTPESEPTRRLTLPIQILYYNNHDKMDTYYFVV